jgi:pyruvate/2-oxoglutarate dehydrogenase complex dihydrolipoamide dehydrogenase (E3) component
VTEDELIQQGRGKGIDYETARVDYKNTAMGSAMKSEVGFVKLIADVKTRKIIGAHIL